VARQARSRRFEQSTGSTKQKRKHVMTGQVWFITGSSRGLGRSVAHAFLDLADNPQPPPHLVPGRDAVDHMARVMRDTAAEDERWAHIGRSVDFG
jgi:hypothetical protein